MSPFHLFWCKRKWQQVHCRENNTTSPPNKRKGFALGVHRPFLSPLPSFIFKKTTATNCYTPSIRGKAIKKLILFIRSNINSNSVIAQPLTLQNTTKSLCLCAVLCFDLPFAITHCWPGAHVFFSPLPTPLTQFFYNLFVYYYPIPLPPAQLASLCQAQLYAAQLPSLVLHYLFSIWKVNVTWPADSLN